MSLSVAVVRGDLYPMDIDTQGLMTVLQSRGVDVHDVVWNDSAVDWHGFDGVLIRSTWGYHLNVEAYRLWLSDMRARGVKIMNSPDLIMWNMHKRYLHDLRDRGIDIVPSTFVPNAVSYQDTVHMLLGKYPDSAYFIMKPAVSASAFKTERVRRDDLLKANRGFQIAEDILAHSDLMMEPFLPEICNMGEVSMTFYNGIYSHSVLKKPCRSDFRVHKAYGGTVTLYDAASSVVETGHRILKALPGNEMPLYARIDGILRDGKFILLEVEANEPWLFNYAHPPANDAFADQVMDWLRQGKAETSKTAAVF